LDITWLGHSCFRVRSKDATVVMDPYNKIQGLELGRPRAEIVTISHDHPGHNNVDGVKGDPAPKVVSGPGEYEISGMFITGVRTYHDAEKGKTLGRNTVYLLESEQMVLAHMGDLGHRLTDEQVDLMSNVDVLLLPVGGGNSLGPERAAEVLAQVEPSIVVPMHYRTAPGQEGLEGVDHFCKEVGLSEYEVLDRLTVRKSDLGETLQVKVLAPRPAS
jgi:L-ascorbate metabolism protein UlaG (beta-lactamase superfamily)